MIAASLAVTVYMIAQTNLPLALGVVVLVASVPNSSSKNSSSQSTGNNMYGPGGSGTTVGRNAGVLSTFLESGSRDAISAFGTGANGGGSNI